MDSLEPVVLRAREGDGEAFAVIVRRFQDMAVGYGYSILRDVHLAEDAAQEAFFEAYRNLDKLREPSAFPGWFRRIVFKQCDRLIRGKSLATVSLEAAESHASTQPDQSQAAERQQMNDKVIEAIESLSEQDRATLMLYYFSGYSQKEVARFLDLPVTTVKKRLHTARGRLRELLMDTIVDTLREQRPSRDEAFATQVMEILTAARGGDTARVKELLERNPRLAEARDPLGNTALILAANSGHSELAALLLDSGVSPDIYEAAAIGRADLVAEMVRLDQALVDSYSPEGFPPLALAAHFGHKETVELLLACGADVDRISKHGMQVTPLHAALFGRKVETAKLLLAHGADVRARRGGAGLPRAGWTALHYAAGSGFAELIKPMLDRGADIHAEDDEGRTPLQVAVEAGNTEVARILRRRRRTRSTQ